MNAWTAPPGRVIIAMVAKNTAAGLATPKIMAWFAIVAALLIGVQFTGSAMTAEEAVSAGEADLAAEILADRAIQVFSNLAASTSFLGLFLGLYAYTTERRRRTIVTLLAHPVSRFEFAVGKALGILLPVLGMLLFGTVCLLAALLVLGVEILPQFYVGILEELAGIACTVAIALALGLHLHPLIACVLLTAVSLLEGQRGAHDAVMHAFGACMYWISPADSPRGLIQVGLGEQVLDLNYGLHFAVIGENLLYGLTLLAVSVAWFSRRDIRLGDA